MHIVDLLTAQMSHVRVTWVTYHCHTIWVVYFGQPVAPTGRYGCVAADAKELLCIT